MTRESSAPSDVSSPSADRRRSSRMRALSVPDESAVQESPHEVPDGDTFEFDKFFPTESDPSFSRLTESFRSRNLPDRSEMSPDNFSATYPVNSAAAIEGKETGSVGAPEKVPDTAKADPGWRLGSTDLFDTLSYSQTPPTQIEQGAQQVSELAHGKSVFSSSEILRSRAPDGEADAVPRESDQGKPRAIKNSTITGAQPSISSPLWRRSESPRRSRPAVLAALGSIAVIGLASFLILGPFHFSNIGNVARSLLQTSTGDEKNVVPSVVEQSSEPSPPVQAPTASIAPAVPAPGPSSQAPTLSDDAGQAPAGDTENLFASSPQSSQTKRQIIANENLAPTESRQDNQYAQNTPVASPASDPPARQASPPSPEARTPRAPSSAVDTANATARADSPRPPDSQAIQPSGPVAGISPLPSPAVDTASATPSAVSAGSANSQAPKVGGSVASTSPSPSSTVNTANATPAAVSPGPPDGQAPKLSYSVVSASQFLGIQMPKTAGSDQLSGVLQIGQLVSNQPPAYPLPALQARVKGTVRLHATVGADGSVQKVDPVSGPSALIPAAMQAVQSWKYQPTTIAGKAVPNEQNITIVFRLSE